MQKAHTAPGSATEPYDVQQIHLNFVLIGVNLSHFVVLRIASSEYPRQIVIVWLARWHQVRFEGNWHSKLHQWTIW